MYDKGIDWNLYLRFWNLPWRCGILSFVNNLRWVKRGGGGGGNVHILLVGCTTWTSKYISNLRNICIEVQNIDWTVFFLFFHTGFDLTFVSIYMAVLLGLWFLLFLLIFIVTFSYTLTKCTRLVEWGKPKQIKRTDSWNTRLWIRCLETLTLEVVIWAPTHVYDVRVVVRSQRP
jgi:hypothetical protein